MKLANKLMVFRNVIFSVFVHTLALVASLIFFSPVLLASTQPDLDINTPSITVIKKSLSQRYQTIKPHLDSGAIGLTADGLLSVRDLTSTPAAIAAKVEAVVAEENQDRGSLYREIARANGHPDWENDLKTTFGERFISRAQSGWYYRDSAGKWTKKP